jgi:hypothetical protein
MDVPSTCVGGPPRGDTSETIERLPFQPRVPCLIETGPVSIESLCTRLCLPPPKRCVRVRSATLPRIRDAPADTGEGNAVMCIVKASLRLVFSELNRSRRNDVARSSLTPSIRQARHLLTAAERHCYLSTVADAYAAAADEAAVMIIIVIVATTRSSSLSSMFPSLCTLLARSTMLADAIRESTWSFELKHWRRRAAELDSDARCPIVSRSGADGTDFLSFGPPCNDALVYSHSVRELYSASACAASMMPNDAAMAGCVFCT